MFEFIIRQLTQTYKAKPSPELIQAWKLALEYLSEEQLHQGMRLMLQDFKSDFLPAPAVFRSYAQRNTSNRTQACKTPDEWLMKEAELKAIGKRLDPCGGQKFFQAIGRAPFGFWLDSDSIVRWTKKDETPVKVDKPSKTDSPSQYFAKLVRTVAA